MSSKNDNIKNPNTTAVATTTAVKTKIKKVTVQKQQDQQLHQIQEQLPLPKLQRKIEEVTADLPNQETVNKLTELPAANSLTVCRYLIAMKTEVNPSKKYRQTNIQTLIYPDIINTNYAMKT